MEPHSPEVHVIVVSGLSGAGRSTALHVLEDAGYYCVDNLPSALFLSLVSLARSGSIQRIALGVDVRTGAFLSGARAAIDELGREGHRVELIFLDCADSVLLTRFSETRRPHALAPDGDIASAIALERERVAPLKARADWVLDTSALTVHDLRRLLIAHVQRNDARQWMTVRFVSFGFKYGTPTDADVMFDVRYLSNPHFVPELRPLSGRDAPVADFVLSSPDAVALTSHLSPLLAEMLAGYKREGKSYLTIAIGCTGGRHRSVVIAERLHAEFRDAYTAVVVHRDIDRA